MYWCLFQGLGMECTSMYEFLLPVIQLSTDLTQPAHVYLLEDALELWEMTLHCAPTATPDLLALFNNMPSLLGELGGWVGWRDGWVSRDYSVYAPSQWETTLQCNFVSHWLGTYTMIAVFEWVGKGGWVVRDGIEWDEVDRWIWIEGWVLKGRMG